MSNHTPGPWRVHSSAPDRILVGGVAYRVRDMTTNEDGQYGRPNPSDVLLMAAAPELLVACKLLAAMEDNDVHPADTRWKQLRKDIRAAIAKAEGRGE